MTSLTTIDGFDAVGVTLWSPYSGRWILSGIVTDEGFALSERQVTATIGTQSFVGTIDLSKSSEHLKTKRVRIVAGANGWQKTIPHQAFHNDAGVKKFTIAKALAKAAGEQLGDEPSDKVGSDWGWKDDQASKIFGSMFPDWYVGFDGKTYTSARSAVAQGKDIEALNYDRESNMVSLAVYETVPVPGMTITDERFGTLTIRSFTLLASGDSITASAWFGPTGATKLAAAVRSVVQQTQTGLWGIYRYRVVAMNSDGRVSLQAVKSGMGLPDQMAVPQTPGLPGWEAELTPGAIVLVQFVDGDPGIPRITGYHENTDGGFVPQSLTYGRGTKPFARVGDGCAVYPGAVVTANFNGVEGVLMFTAPLYGAITTGRAGLRG